MKASYEFGIGAFAAIMKLDWSLLLPCPSIDGIASISAALFA